MNVEKDWLLLPHLLIMYQLTAFLVNFDLFIKIDQFEKPQLIIIYYYSNTFIYISYLFSNEKHLLQEQEGLRGVHQSQVWMERYRKEVYQKRRPLCEFFYIESFVLHYC